MTVATRNPLDLNARYAVALEPLSGPLDPDILLAQAQTATALSDWGGSTYAEERFRERLGICVIRWRPKALSPVLDAGVRTHGFW